MTILCRLGLHRWRYHYDGNQLPERRRCIKCSKHQWMVGGTWR